MNLFKTKTHADKSREKSYAASVEFILKQISYVAGNGHFTYTTNMKRDFGDSGISLDIVERLKLEIEKQGYEVKITDNSFIVKW